MTRHRAHRGAWSLDPWRVIFAVMAALTVGNASDWPGFRGRGDSIATDQGLPLHWSDSTNVAWRTELPGPGQSSPVCWQGTVWVTSIAGARKEQCIVQAMEAGSGKELWRHTQTSALPEELSDARSQAAPTPVVGSDGIFAFFESGDLLALNHTGELRWHRVLSREVGELAGNHGLGGSPTLAGDLLLVPLDQEKPSCLVALDRRTGTTRWKASRPGRTGWNTPLFVDDPVAPQVVVSGGGTVTSYRASDGRALWELAGFVKNLVPSPSLSPTLLVIAAGSKGSNVAFDWKGATNAPVERWRADDVSSGFASPLVHRGRVYFVGTAGVLNCRDAASGRLLFDERISQSVWASPIGAGDRVYLFGEKGSSTVLAADDRFSPLATNRLTVSKKVVGVAAADGAFFIRSQSELVRIGSRPRP